MEHDFCVIVCVITAVSSAMSYTISKTRILHRENYCRARMGFNTVNANKSI